MERQGLKDIPFKRVGHRRLLLDVHRPAGDGPHPAILWICGGGWKGMSKDGGPKVAGWIVEQGFALLPFEYRVSGEALFPAQILDCKAALRWLRANAESCGIDPERIGVWGDSAGGHLAELLGATGDFQEFGGGGPLPDVSTAVRAVCAFYPPADFTAFPRENREVPALLGGEIDEKPEAARAASPIAYVGPHCPPHLLAHGDADEIVPIAQSHAYRDALRAAGVEVELHTLPGVGHSGQVLYGDEELRRKIAAFFDRHLKSAP